MLCEESKLVDETDARILEILLGNARTSLNRIAKTCGLSSSAVLSRLEKLKKEKVIVGTNVVLKRGTLGFPYEASVGIAIETQKIESVVQAIRKVPNVIVCTKSIGRYNAMCLIVARSTEEIDRVTQEIKNIPGVKGIAINLWMDEPFHMRYETDKKTKGSAEKPNRTDLGIITELLKDARVPFSNIASILGISHETVRQKYARMMENGTILGSSIVVDWSKLGYQGNLFIFISQGSGNDRSITVNELKKISDLLIVTRVMGAFDILAMALAKSLKDTARLLDEIQKIPTVEQVEFCYATFSYFSFTPAPRKPFKVDTLELT